MPCSAWGFTFCWISLSKEREKQLPVAGGQLPEFGETLAACDFRYLLGRAEACGTHYNSSHRHNFQRRL